MINALLYHLSNLNIYYKWINTKKSFRNDEFKTFAPTWNKEFGLPDGSYSVSDIQDYFDFIIKNHETATDNSSIRICVKTIENRITFKIKTSYYLKRLQ